MGIIMAVLLGVLSLFLLWTLWGRMAHALQMLQQCHYMGHIWNRYMYNAGTYPKRHGKDLRL